MRKYVTFQDKKKQRNFYIQLFSIRIPSFIKFEQNKPLSFCENNRYEKNTSLRSCGNLDNPFRYFSPKFRNVDMYVSLSCILAFRKACFAAVCLAFIGNFVALFTLIMWILNVGSTSTAKILKIVTMVLLGIAGKIYPTTTEHCFVN